MPEIPHLTKSTGDYLKGLYVLDPGGEPVSTNALAVHLDVAPASVTSMLQKLSAENPALVHYTKHYGATLTSAGRTAALRLVRRHRLVELFLARVLGYTWDEVHAEADELEHVITQRFEDRLAELLGEPDFDPHGDPIPNRELQMPADTAIPLSRLPLGVNARLCRVAGRRPEVLRRLGEMGLRPGAFVCVTDRNSLDQTIHMTVGEGGSAVLGPALANVIWVEKF